MNIKNFTLLTPKVKRYGPPALTMGIPVGYIVTEHISWKRKKPDSLRRMIVQQASFWVAAIAGGLLMHDTQFQNRPFRWKLPRFALASALLIGGFSGGEALAKTLFPKKPSNSPDRFINSRESAGQPQPLWNPANSTPPLDAVAPALASLNGPFVAN